VKPPLWITREDCVAIHEMMLAQHRGLDGIRDEGLLESALLRPQNQFAYGKPTLPELAAAYTKGVVQNHPFSDGNKRTGFMVGAVFLETNGLTFGASEEEVVSFTVALAAKEISERAYAVWMAKNATVASGRSPGAGSK
jgi:death-on-curing protein